MVSPVLVCYCDILGYSRDKVRQLLDSPVLDVLLWHPWLQQRKGSSMNGDILLWHPWLQQGHGQSVTGQSSSGYTTVTSLVTAGVRSVNGWSVQFWIYYCDISSFVRQGLVSSGRSAVTSLVTPEKRSVKEWSVQFWMYYCDISGYTREKVRQWMVSPILVCYCDIPGYSRGKVRQGMVSSGHSAVISLVTPEKRSDLWLVSPVLVYYCDIPGYSRGKVRQWLVSPVLDILLWHPWLQQG